MSSLRNAVKRITHKERSQPTNRQHLGLLEKKKDYRIRSQDYHRKEDELTRLRKKASERNPDEFYFGMNRSEIKNGKHRKINKFANEDREKEIGPEAVKLMKSQDLNYVRMQTLKDMRKVERLQASLHYLGDNPTTSTDIGLGGDELETMDKKSRKHTVFVDDRDKAKTFNVAQHFDTLPELANRTFNRPRKETLIKIINDNSGTNEVEYDENGEECKYVPTEKQLHKQQKLQKIQARKVAKARSTAYAEMEARQKRIELLKNTEAHLVVEKIVASKGRKRKIKEAENGKPAIYKFRRKRAR